METAICGRVALSPNHVFHPKPGDKFSLQKQCTNRIILTTISAMGSGKGGGLLEKPTIERTTPGRDSEFDLRKSRKMSPPYRVLLHNDNYNKREYVVQVLMKVIPGMTVDNAVNIMQEAHINYVTWTLQNKSNTRVGHPTLGQGYGICVGYFSTDISYIIVYNTVIICTYCCIITINIILTL